jgi:tRNA dimethylallyltransferase
LDELLAEVQARDPVTYGVIDRQNPRRIVRAIEVIRLTGRPFSEQRAEWGAPAAVVETPNFFLIQRPAPELQARINGRVEDMFRRGLVEETQQLLQLGLTQNRTAMQAIGYRQVVEHLHEVRSLGETIELVKSRTRQFAKRQMTWFRRHARARAVELKNGESAHAALKLMLEGLKD